MAIAAPPASAAISAAFWSRKLCEDAETTGPVASTGAGVVGAPPPPTMTAGELGSGVFSPPPPTSDAGDVASAAAGTAPPTIDAGLSTGVEATVAACAAPPTVVAGLKLAAYVPSVAWTPAAPTVVAGLNSPGAETGIAA